MELSKIYTPQSELELINCMARERPDPIVKLSEKYLRLPYSRDYCHDRTRAPYGPGCTAFG